MVDTHPDDPSNQSVEVEVEAAAGHVEPAILNPTSNGVVGNGKDAAAGMAMKNGDHVAGTAQGHVVTGLVYWYGTQKPAVGAVVHAVRSDDPLTPAQTCETDSDGRFIFASLPSGRWSFIAFHPDQDGRPRWLNDQVINADRFDVRLDVSQAICRDTDRPAPPRVRRLRVYAFDPSLTTGLENVGVSHVTLPVRWEDDLAKGPVGEYLEVIDHDPASQCFYTPVNLDDPYALAQDGLEPREDSPQFHQQMVYAVAMTTIDNFERALDRPIFWAPRDSADGTLGQQNDRSYVPRLRIYPHALRAENAYYSPRKKALLFGYFPTATSAYHQPGSTIFSCLSHDIIAHETTHALLDGLRPGFNRTSNQDVAAFHEAFADIVALFQHFSFPEVVRHQIERTRGDLTNENLLAQLAREFGQALGSHAALRDAIGHYNNDGQWERAHPKPSALAEISEPHKRGAILVAAIFDAFLQLYKVRSEEMIGIATGGTRNLPPGSLRSEVVQALAREAAHVARNLLTRCIRALDYCPPIDVTFGDYLRALITADYELAHDDETYGLALIDTFQKHGIYCEGVGGRSPGNFRWPESEPFNSTQADTLFKALNSKVQPTKGDKSRETLYNEAMASAERLCRTLGNNLTDIPGLDLTQKHPYVHILPVSTASQMGRYGQTRNMVVQIIQASRRPEDAGFRGACTLHIDLEERRIRYVIAKDVADTKRRQREHEYLRQSVDMSLRATYFGGLSSSFRGEPFAMLHQIAETEIWA